MLRAPALGVALALVAVACALVEPPPPPGTRMVEAQVRNNWPDVVVPVVKTPAGVIPGAVQPATLPPLSTTTVRFFVPLGGEWSVGLNPGNDIPASDFNQISKPGCAPSIEIGDDGSYGYGCGR
jgi:hypothetical protein